jgi:succinate dehydrogenase/fumarate reductase cytochrome b subunit
MGGSMKEIHYFSGLTITIFVGIHLLNHALILHSSEWHIAFMNAARKIYRHPIIETILLAAVCVQIVTGIYLVHHKWGSVESIFDFLHIASGLYMSLFLIVHVSAVLMGRYKLGLDTNLYFGVGYMNVSPQRYFFIPYYAFAITSFFIHVACIHKIRMSKYVALSAAQNQSIGIIVIGVIFTLVVITRMASLHIPSDGAKGKQTIEPNETRQN